MEIVENNIRISTKPFITIADEPLDKCSLPVIAKEISLLVKVIRDQRDTIAVLRGELHEKLIDG